MATPSPRPAPGRRRDVPDAILREIVKGTFSAMVREMAVLIERTAMSPIIREKQDYGMGLFDASGRMIVSQFLMQAPGMIDIVLEHFPLSSMRAGDVYCYNDPYLSRGAIGHVPDITFCVPVVRAGEVRCFVALFGHFWDLAGLTPGGLSPNATEVFHEGLLIPPLRLIREGELVDDVYRMIIRNSRFPDYHEADMRACISGCRMGVERVEELFDRYGVERILTAFDDLLEQSRTSARALLDKLLPDGVFEGSDQLDGDGFSHGPFGVRLQVRRSNGRTTFDFSGTAAQAKGPINFILHPGILTTVLLGRVLEAYDPSILLNDGLADIVDEMRLPEGSLLSPTFPASVALRALTRNTTMNAILEALGSARNGEVPAGSANYGIVTLRAQEEGSGKTVYCFEGFGVGQGARPWADGIDSVYLIGQKNNPAEWLEAEYPFRVERYAIARDSGGPGTFRGGVGVVREVRILAPEATLCTMMINAVHPAKGVSGGEPGRLGRIVLNPGGSDGRALPSLADDIPLKRGDVVRIESAGGGGWGNPFERDPHKVAWDYLKGYVSCDAARNDYGVVLAPDSGEVLQEETEAERNLRVRRVEQIAQAK